MRGHEIGGEGCINWRILLLLSLLVLLTYSNTFDSSWHLDDLPKITKNFRLHIADISPGNLYQNLLSKSGSDRAFYRPISCLTFAINWYLGKADVTGYHVVNISIHILTAFFLYLAVLALFSTPNLEGKYRGSEHFIALLAASLWAVNPIQTQAVTYIVQRMAAMAAMFSILGIYLYIKARISDSLKKRIPLYIGMVAAFVLAVGSKENALMFPVSLLLLEMVFFRDMSNPGTRKNFVFLGCGLVLAMFLVGSLLFMQGNFLSRILEGYENRTFTLSERLLTEPRIVIFYLTQIFYPIAERLSITHDIEVSASLFDPWTTLPAILLILGLVGLSFCRINRNPLFSFAILFFFLNHIIESSILPLELVFEHRNYLPSLFLFVPVAAGLKWVIDYYAREKYAMSVFLVCFVTVLAIALGVGTYARNMVWANEKTLWEDAIEKAPGRARPYQNLASGHYAKMNDFDKALRLYEKAASLEDDTLHKAEVLSLANMAGIYAEKKQEYEKAIILYKKVINISPHFKNARYNLVLALLDAGRLEEAFKYTKKFVSKKPNSVKYLNLKAFILVKIGRPENALSCLKNAVKEAPDNEKLIVSIAKAKSMTGKYRSAEHYLNRVPENSPNKIMALFLLIENSLLAGDRAGAEDYVEDMMSRFSPQKIINTLEKLEESDANMLWPVKTDLVAPVIAGELEKRSEEILQLTEANGG